MKNLLLNFTAEKYEDKMLARNFCESANSAELKYQNKKAKRYRSAFTTGQINYLEEQFKKFPYIGNACRKEVANVLNIPERAVKIWFQNRRMKEKKEVTNKDISSIDRPKKSINNMEFAKDPLNNVHYLQSTNDYQYSFQPENHVINIDNNNCNDEFKKSAITKHENLKRGTVDYNKSFHHKKNITDKYEILNINKKISSTTEHLSKSNLNKIYNNNNFIKYLESNKNEELNKRKMEPKIKLKENCKSRNSSILNIPRNLPGPLNYQDMPEDLSASKKSNMTIPQKKLQNVNLSSAYIPFCNTENYFTPYVSAGSVIWKPINLMPIVPSQSTNSLPIAISAEELSAINQINMQKGNCNCNCHMKNLLNHDQGIVRSTGPSHPQYVIAIPLNKNSNE